MQTSTVPTRPSSNRQTPGRKTNASINKITTRLSPMIHNLTHNTTSMPNHTRVLRRKSMAKHSTTTRKETTQGRCSIMRKHYTEIRRTTSILSTEVPSLDCKSWQSPDQNMSWATSIKTFNATTTIDATRACTTQATTPTTGSHEISTKLRAATSRTTSTTTRKTTTGTIIRLTKLSPRSKLTSLTNFTRSQSINLIGKRDKSRTLWTTLIATLLDLRRAAKTRTTRSRQERWSTSSRRRRHQTTTTYNPCKLQINKTNSTITSGIRDETTSATCARLN